MCANVFCTLEVFPPFEEISTLQVLQVALLSSFLVKGNQTERLYRLGAMFTVDRWLHWSRYATRVVTSFTSIGIDKGIVCKIGKRFQGIETLNKNRFSIPIPSYKLIFIFLWFGLWVDVIIFKPYKPYVIFGKIE